MEPYIWIAEADDPAGMFRRGDRITALPGAPDAVVRHKTLPPNYGRLLELEGLGVLRCVTPALPRDRLQAAVGASLPLPSPGRSPSGRSWAARRGHLRRLK